MDKLLVMLKTIGGVMCLVSVGLMLWFIPIPVPVTYVNYAMAIVTITSILTGLGLLISAVLEEDDSHPQQ